MTALDQVLANLDQGQSTPVVLSHGGRRRALVIGRKPDGTLVVQFVGRNGWSRTAYTVLPSAVLELIPGGAK